MIRKETIILGAGLTGLAAANRLQEKGSDYLLIEQSGTFGGLTRTMFESVFI